MTYVLPSLKIMGFNNVCGVIDKTLRHFFGLTLTYSAFRYIAKTLFFSLKYQSNRAKFSPIKDAELSKAEIKDAILLDKTDTLQAVLLSQ